MGYGGDHDSRKFDGLFQILSGNLDALGAIVGMDARALVGAVSPGVHPAGSGQRGAPAVRRPRFRRQHDGPHSGQGVGCRASRLPRGFRQRQRHRRRAAHHQRCSHSIGAVPGHSCRQVACSLTRFDAVHSRHLARRPDW